MGNAETFHGYGPEQGYDFLREAIRDYYKTHGVTLEADEVFVSDGAKSDLGNITDLFSQQNKVLIPDPVYPVYVDTNLMNGREIVYLPANEGNGFLPAPPDFAADVIYLCSPNNPTGAVYDRNQLKAWVDYANRSHAVILFDAAYEVFITQPELPHSIFEIEGARTCAIEFCSFSKMARLYRYALWVYGCAKGTDVWKSIHEPDVEPPADHQVQRRTLYRTAWRSSSFHTGGQGADPVCNRVLQRKCKNHCPWV